MSTGAIVVVGVVGLLVAVFVPLRIDVAKQRRAVETVGARLAAAAVRRRATSVPVEVVLKIGDRFTHVSRASTVALADDGLYCLSDDGRWGGRVCLSPRAPGPGDVTLAAPPALVKDRAAADAELPAWLVSGLAQLPADGLLLQLHGDLTWFVAVPDTSEWHAALVRAIRGLA